MNNTVITLAVGIIVIIIGFFVWGLMTDTDVDISRDSTPTGTSQAQLDAEREREAEFQRQRQEAEDNEVAFTVDVSNLPEVQQTALGTMGISSTSSINITNKMVECAAVDMSETRMAEIQDGATLTAAEGIRLMSCYNANN